MPNCMKKVLMFTALVVSLGSFAVVGATAQETGKAATPPASTAPCVPWVEVVRALAWPLGALVIALVFRRAIAVFVSALGTRVTKLSLFKVELELVPAAPAVTTPLFDDIRTPTTVAAIGDSSRAMLEQVQVGTAADYAIIDLGEGDAWLTSRLFIAAVMLERMRRVQVLVFLEKAGAADQHFVAVAPVRLVRWALAQSYPHLEAAWAAAYPPLFPGDPKFISTPPAIITSDAGAVDPGVARQLVARFIGTLQRPLTPALAAADWVSLSGTMPVEERAAWVTREMLRELLPADSFQAWSYAFNDAPRAKRTRAILRRPGSFVALTDAGRNFIRLVNRRAFLEEMAVQLGEEPEGASA